MAIVTQLPLHVTHIFFAVYFFSLHSVQIQYPLSTRYACLAACLFCLQFSFTLFYLVFIARFFIFIISHHPHSYIHQFSWCSSVSTAWIRMTFFGLLLPSYCFVYRNLCFSICRCERVCFVLQYRSYVMILCRSAVLGVFLFLFSLFYFLWLSSSSPIMLFFCKKNLLDRLYDCMVLMYVYMFCTKVQITIHLNCAHQFEFWLCNIFSISFTTFFRPQNLCLFLCVTTTTNVFCCHLFCIMFSYKFVACYFCFNPDPDEFTTRNGKWKTGKFLLA